MDLYKDTSKSIPERVKDLISRMTLDEKIAQIGSISGRPEGSDKNYLGFMEQGLVKNGIGQMSAPARSTGLPAKELAEYTNTVQKYLVEQTRLGIPAIIHEECINGMRAKGTTVFPQAIGLASTWEPELVEKMTEIIRLQMRATGFHQALSPVLDIARDPRWGRTEESYGEDPHLDSRMAVAFVKGLQGEDISKGVVATVKHFVGHGYSEGGMNCAPANITPRLLREVYLYPFEQAVKEAGVLSLMNAYHEIDGIPCAASEELLTKILRDEWGFDGIVVSDYYAIRQLMTYHTIAADGGEAAGLALKAGIDVELPDYDCYAEPLKDYIEQGKVSEELINTAVERVLTMKFRLGLFENPYVDPDAAKATGDPPEQREFSREIARKSIVLLKDDGNILPLNKDAVTIAVIGPSADSQRNLLGDYSFGANYGYRMRRDPVTNELVVEWYDEDYHHDHVISNKIVSILEGIKAKLGSNTKVLYEKGCDVTGTSEDGIDKAVTVAKVADVAVVAVGGRSGLLNEYTSGEMRDRAELGLPGIQEKLVEAVSETGTPVVLVLVNGRPYTLKHLLDKVTAVVEVWLPGEEGGNAVADVLFGDYNPGGRLPMSFPEKEGQIPVYYAHKPSGGRSSQWEDYVDGSSKPLFPFGYGLSYTTFGYSNLKISPVKISADGEVTVKVDVKNTGKIAGDEVVQLYINDIIATVPRPVKELKAFKRVNLKPDEAKNVELTVKAESLSFYNLDMKRVVEPGVFKVMIGSSSDNILLEGEFEVI
ncbi:MAG: glycoside hydrolase family 3 C-terminal domain-containing protein [Dehalococcoidales bacterium]|nr:MAG: glycoside hydrolase family 3 C-terminal domain-containing protein [Dehalococcoidales bacterium]